MDFGDIFTLLIYIAIPLFVSGKRNANKAKKAQQRRKTMQGQPAQRQQPVQSQTARGKSSGGGLMGRLESMMKEIERSMETGEPIGAPKPLTKPAEPITQSKMHGIPGDGSVTDGTPDQRGGIPVWRVAAETKSKGTQIKPRAEEKPAFKKVPVAAAGQSGPALFGKDDLVKGIILSEILQPPVTLRQQKNRRPF